MAQGRAATTVGLLHRFPFAPLAAQLAGESAELLYANYTVARGAAEMFFTVGSVLSLGFGPLLLGLAWFRSSRGRWLAWTGVVTGLTGAVWFVWLVENAAFGIVTIANVLLSLVFFAGASVVMVARART